MKDLSFNASTNKMPIIRIAPVCNGKIYVVPRHSSENKSVYWDLPIEERVEHISQKSDKVACRVKEKYHAHIHTQTSPRFSIIHQLPSHQESTIYLYILPLQEESDIHFHNGRFIAAEEIAIHPEQYSIHLQQEGELLGLAAELWNDFFQDTFTQ
jgi:hypothetical protein